MQDTYDVVIIGAGPGGLSAAKELSKNNQLKILIIEAGKDYKKRVCSVDNGMTCSECKNNCNVISGFGGCIHYGDAIKLSFMPSARKLSSLLKEKANLQSDKIFNDLQNIIEDELPLTGINLSKKITKCFSKNKLDIREYPISVISESKTKKIIEYYSKYINSSNNIQLLLNSQVIKIDKNTETDKFNLSVVTEKGLQNIYSRKVIFSTGRNKVFQNIKILESLDIIKETPTISVGVRLEMNKDILKSIGEVHPDLKISHKFPSGIKTKTFCFCGGNNGGRIKFTRYNEIDFNFTILDGHVTQERAEYSVSSLSSNLAILIQHKSDKTDSYSIVEQFIKNDLLGITNKPVTQHLTSFLNKQAPQQEWQELKNTISFKPSVNDLTTAPLYELFSHEENEHLKEFIIKFMKSVSEFNDTQYNFDDILVVGPEIEFFWDTVDLTKDCETNIPGFFIVGDFAGKAQGIVPAMIMGQVVAENILKKHST